LQSAYSEVGNILYIMDHLVLSTHRIVSISIVELRKPRENELANFTCVKHLSGTGHNQYIQHPICLELHDNLTFTETSSFIWVTLVFSLLQPLDI
jgi:hypothetical protein